ncbi:Transcriptional regulator PadR-like family [Geoglobus ahangari]|uniref:Transcriptional regulator PadR-like family n=1 Tax=Geoglobus ahangari TaxID=113653 RepID=A0A0F7IEJ1_9EURY|nr:winged helix-turn-helix domain-containing protein [Geoglobus ahangari]AKG91964.1 Transcriptional regulator PadR-like family [Geoglobus ahangari]
MAIISKAKFEILKELSKSPQHGYALAKKLNITISSVYTHLSELEEGGFIEHEVSKRRKIYRLTEKGEQLLKLLIE